MGLDPPALPKNLLISKDSQPSVHFLLNNDHGVYIAFHDSTEFKSLPSAEFANKIISVTAIC